MPEVTEGIVPQPVIPIPVEGFDSLYAVDPDSLPDHELSAYLERCATALVTALHGISAVKYLLGKILLAIYTRRDMYQSYGTFEQFLQQAVIERFNIARSEVYAAMRVARKWPDLSPEEVGKIGMTKMLVLCKFATQEHENWRKLLSEARNRNVVELKRWAENRGLLEKGEADVRFIKLPANVYEELQEVLKNPKVHAIVGTDDPSAILRAMIQEVRSTWQV